MRLQAADFSPAVLDPRVSGNTADRMQQEESIPGGILPAGFQLIDLNPAGDLEVVGELNYWSTLQSFRAEYGKNVVAVLEPLQEEHGVSVRVSLLSGERYYHIGFLPAAVAPQYYAVLDRLTRNRQIGLCPARIWWPEGEAESIMQVYLRLAPADQVLPEASPEGPYFNITGYTPVVVTKEEEHQQALDFFGPQERIWFHLGFAAIKTGKYAGERTVQVRIEDHIVGELTHLMGQRYGALVETGIGRGQRVICQGSIRDEGERGLQVELLLPSQDALRAGVSYDKKD